MIKKFKTFEEASKDLWCMHPDEAYYKRLSEFYKLASSLTRRKIPRGIFKFKTFEEAQKHRDTYIAEEA